jgi:glucose/arabinose dehydrogenase
VKTWLSLNPLLSLSTHLSRAALLVAALSALTWQTGAAQLKIVAEGFVSPVSLVPLPDKSGRILVGDQVGQIYVVDKDGGKKLLADLNSKITPKLLKGFDERGLLGLALHPKFESNGRLFACYSAPLRASMPTNWDHTMHISEFKVNGKGETIQLDPASEKIVLEIDKPYFNHNAGAIAFGPDKYLYISVGDGGNGNDEGVGHSPQGNGQDTNKLLGKMLRIDVDHQGKETPYGIPRDNPFANGKEGRPEIFAYGLRNSWRMSFDRGGKHELFAGEIGQDLFEEVNIIRKGGNYGWNVREGFHCFDPKNPNKSPENCPDKGADGKPFIDPIFEYRNFKGAQKDPSARGISVIGGSVYRGKALPELTGAYVFADWSHYFIKGEGIMLKALPPKAGSGPWTVETLQLSSHPKSTLPAFIVGMGEDADGELYFMSNNTSTLTGTSGKVYKLVP